jgi:acetyl-CoA acetyltransferase
MTDLAIVGAGIHPFGRTELTAQQMAQIAIGEALADAGSWWGDVEVAVGGSLDGGQADVMVGDLGATSLPFINVLNGCATGTAALITAQSLVASGRGRLGVVVGMDKHAKGAFTADPTEWGVGSWYGETGFFLNPQFFALKIQRYMHEHQIPEQALVDVAVKAYANGALAPHAWRRKPLSAEEVRSSMMLNEPLRQYMICSPSAGAVALVVCPAEDAERYTDTPVYVRATSLRSRLPGSFELFQTSLPPEQPATPSELAAADAYRAAALTASDIDVWQLQDTEVGAEIMHMAEVGLCEHGKQPAMLAAGETAISGRSPVNTDGGLIANGEPVGASGLRMIYENVTQLRGRAGERQVQNSPRHALSHVYGAPGISAVTILSREQNGAVHA